MRPRYERGEDLEAEEGVINRFCAMMEGQGWRLDHVKLNPAAYRIDYALYESSSRKVELVCEVKRRKVSIAKYPTLILSASKIQAGMRFEPDTPFYVVIGWDDVIGYMRPAKHSAGMSLYVAGRTDRGDGYDIEPVYCYPIEMFKQLSW